MHVAVAVAEHRRGLEAGGGHAETEHHVVEAPLEILEQVLAGDALVGLRPREVPPELRLEHPVDAFGLLLLAQLDAVLGRLGATPPLLPRPLLPPPAPP